jgi:hypothetical protein
MRPTMIQETGKAPTNLPRIGVVRHVGLAEHIEDFISGFREYAKFLYPTGRQLFDGFAGLPVRKVVRPTQFYSMLMQRLIDDRTMDDGVLWSSQADFARLSDWDSDADDSWPPARRTQCSSRADVPLFTGLTDGLERAKTASEASTRRRSRGKWTSSDTLRPTCRASGHAKTVHRHARCRPMILWRCRARHSSRRPMSSPR